jgi:hypothetical protein
MQPIRVFILAAVTLLLFALAGCQSTEYIKYAETQQIIGVAKANAESEKYKALSKIAESGDTSAKVAAVMGLAMGNASGGAASSTMAPPPPNQLLQWASILVPGLVQVYGIRTNADVAMRSSDNAAATSIATTAGFVGLAAKIQAPGATYTISGNSGANSGDATSTPTVVNQPAPVVVQPTVVNQPAPVVVQPTVVNQPAPVIVPPTIVNQPAPVIVPPTIVNQPAPVIVLPSFPPVVP